MALSACLTVLVVSHKNGGSARLGRAFTAGSDDTVVLVDLVVFHDGKLGFLAFVLDFLGGRVIFLLLLFGTTTETENKMKS